MGKGTVAVVEETRQEKAVATLTASSAMATRQNADIMDKRGKENIGKEDIRVPRIAIAQKTSPEIVRGEERFIEGVEFTHLFNTLTREGYGNGPLTIVPILNRKRAMEFDDEQKIVDFDVPVDFKDGRYVDDRLNFNEETDEKPRATLFYEFVVLVVRGDEAPELALLSLKTTQVRTAQDFLTIIKGRKGASWDGQYKLSTTRKKFPKGDAGVYKILPAGPTPDDIAAYAEAMYEGLKDKNIVTDADASADVQSDDL